MYKIECASIQYVNVNLGRHLICAVMHMRRPLPDYKWYWAGRDSLLHKKTKQTKLEMTD